MKTKLIIFLILLGIASLITYEAHAQSAPYIALTWESPLNDGGYPVTGYMIERSTDAGATWNILINNTNSNTTAYTDNTVMPSTTYTYRISAINSVDTGATSNTASATSLSDSTQNNISINLINTTSDILSAEPYEITLHNFNASVGGNRLLVVGITANNNDVSSVTFSGIDLIKRAKSFYNNDAEFWYLINPIGSGDIVVKMNGNTAVIVGAYSISGVDQLSPIPTKIIRHNTTPNSPAISMTTLYPNSLVLDLPSIYGGVTIADPTCMEKWNVNIPNEITGASSSSIQNPVIYIKCKWTATSLDLWDDIMIEVKALDNSIITTQTTNSIDFFGFRI